MTTKNSPLRASPTALSGTEQGAGGVGGLLAVSVDGQYYFPCSDHNGNVMAYVSESGAIVAQYTYTPFGEVMSAAGPMAGVFRLRFSTKYQDEATGLYYYGYRFYDPAMMRFISRDPIEEQGGLNLYGFVGNDPVNRWDSLGLATVPWGEVERVRNFSQLKEQLKNQLKAKCPLSATSWKKRGSEECCCTPKACEEEAQRIADSYIGELIKAERYRRFPGGYWGNVWICWRCPYETVTFAGVGNDYEDVKEVNYTCGGWAAMAEHALQHMMDGFRCWTFATETRGRYPIINVPRHMWASVQIMDLEKIHLDPWPSGGASY